MKKALCLILSAALVSGLGYSTGQHKVLVNDPVKVETAHYTNERVAPIDRDSVIESLVQKGKLASDASEDQITKALKDYVGDAVYKQDTNKYAKKQASIIQNKISEGLKTAEYDGNKIGQATKNVLAQASNIAYPEPKKTVKVLVLLGDFTDLEHNKMAKPDLSRIYWTKDFSEEHYQNLLFGDGYYTTPEGKKSPTFKQYFKEQSNGNLNVEGKVFGWYKTPHDGKYYGEDSDTSHNIRAKDFIIDTVNEAVKAGVDLSEYDMEDPYDYDNDKNLEEPDGIVDHLMIIHAGMGQEQGDGGVLGKDAIWSHSSSVGAEPVLVDESKNMSILSYTTEAENGAVGLFTHEFVHDLGIPDDYDTIYSADGDIVEYWSLMASGSWSGVPGGTMPSGINPYSRILLGLIHGGKWINWDKINYADLTNSKLTLDTATMNTGNTQALLFNLPKDKNILVLNKPIAGLQEFYGGTGSEIDNNMTVKLDLRERSAATLTYDIWYDIEENWDGGFVQVSSDGTNWTSLSTPNMVSDFENPEGYPTIINSLPGYTGSSNGWINENINLSGYAGKEIYLRFRYATDWGTELPGMFIDNISVTADGKAIFSNGAESDFAPFTSNGFEISNGTRQNSHYYVAEWRSYNGVDEGLKYNARAKVQYNQGMALWYINKNYTDNWVGVHPGFGQLGLVDATQYVYLNAGLGNGNESGLRAGYMPFIQMHDAAFSISKSPAVDLSVYPWAKNPNLPSMQAEPLFDDSKSYFNVKSPFSGLKLPNLDLKIRVTGAALDYSRGEISISK